MTTALSRLRLQRSAQALVLGLIALSAKPSTVSAQEVQPLSLHDAIALALAQHPSARRAEASQRVARADARVAESALLPRLDLSVEMHRATGNVVPGTQLALLGIPAVAGPPTATQFDSGAWGTGLGATASFDIAAYLRHERERDATLAGLDAQTALVEANELDIAYAVTVAYLTLVAATARVQAIAAWRERAETLVTVTDTLVAQELRAGAEAARARAELAAAITLHAQAHQAELEARAALASALGDPDRAINVDASLLDHTDELSVATDASHALERAREAELAAARRTREARELAYLPRIEALASLWARGSGIAAPSRASDLGDAAGLVPNVPNWSLGFVVSYALFDLPLLDARLEEADARIADAEAAVDEQSLELRSLQARARARLEGAREVAHVAPDAAAAYQAALTQARARYESGLATILDVVDAERALAQADLEVVTARAALLQASFDLAYAHGDLDVFRREAGE